MNFYDVLEEVGEGLSQNPYASKEEHSDLWLEGYIDIDFLNEHFGHLETAEQMKNATNSEGLKLYFDYLKQQGILS